MRRMGTESHVADRRRPRPAFWSCILNAAPAVLALAAPVSLGTTCTRRRWSHQFEPTIAPPLQTLLLTTWQEASLQQHATTTPRLQFQWHAGHGLLKNAGIGCDGKVQGRTASVPVAFLAALAPVRVRAFLEFTANPLAVSCKWHSIISSVAYGAAAGFV